jgi:hypothetical protein
MSSKPTIESARPNGAKSKLVSSSCSLLASLVVLDHERPEDFDALLAGLMSEFHPSNGIQGTLVESMAVARWRLLRLSSIEHATLQAEIEKRDGDDIGDATGPAPHLASPTRTLALLKRYRSHFSRQFSGSRKLLLKLASETHSRHPITGSADARRRPLPSSVFSRRVTVAIRAPRLPAA